MNPASPSQIPPAHPPLLLHPPRRAMSQEGANLPQEVEGSHGQATAPHGSNPAGVGSPTATVMPAGSNSISDSKLASAVNNAGSSERASTAVLDAGDDSNAFKIAGPAVLLAGEENKAESKLASPAVLVAGEEKGNNAAGSKLASPAVIHAGDENNGGSKIASPAVPHAIVDNTTDSKLNSPAELQAGEHSSPAVLHASKDMDNNAGRSKFASPLFLHAGEAKKARTTKLAIQAVPQAAGNGGSSRLTRSAALRAGGSAGSKLAIQVVPCPHTGKDISAGSSKAARPAAADAGKSNAKEGKNKVAGEQRAHDEAGVGGGSRKGNAAAAEDADHELHIFTERERRKKMKNMFSTLHGLLPQLPDKADKSTIVGEAVTYIKTLEGTVQKLEKLKLERQRALAAQQQQQQLVVAGAGSSSGASSARHPAAPAPALPAPPPAAAAPASREANLADMVHAWEAQAQQAAVAATAAANKALAAAGAGGSSSSSAAAPALPRGPVPFPAPAAGFQTWTGHNVVVSVANNEAFINLHSPRQPGTLTKALFVLERHRIDVVTTTISTQDGFRMYGIHARVNPAPASARFPENLGAEDRFKLAVSEIVQLISIV